MDSADFEEFIRIHIRDPLNLFLNALPMIFERPLMILS